MYPSPPDTANRRGGPSFLRRSTLQTIFALAQSSALIGVIYFRGVFLNEPPPKKLGFVFLTTIIRFLLTLFTILKRYVFHNEKKTHVFLCDEYPDIKIFTDFFQNCSRSEDCFWQISRFIREKVTFFFTRIVFLTRATIEVATFARNGF